MANRRRFREWSIWGGILFLAFLGVFHAFRARVATEGRLLAELLRFDLIKLQRGREPHFRMTGAWSWLRKALETSAPFPELHRKTLAALSEGGFPGTRLVLLDRTNGTTYPQDPESGGFSRLLADLADHRHDEFATMTRRIETSFVSFPIHLAGNSRREHRFYRIPIPGNPWFLAWGRFPGKVGKGKLYLVLIEEKSAIWPSITRTWMLRFSRELGKTWKPIPHTASRRLYSLASDRSRQGKAWRGIIGMTHAACIDFPEDSCLAQVPVSPGTQLWLFLGILGIAALGFHKLAGPHLETGKDHLDANGGLSSHILRKLGPAVGLPLLAIIVIGDIVLSLHSMNLFESEFRALPQELEQVDEELSAFQQRTENRIGRILEPLRPVFTASEAMKLAFSRLEGRELISAAPIFASSGVFLLPFHEQNKMGFLFTSQLGESWRRWYNDRHFLMSEKVTPYHEKLVRAGEHPMTREEVRNFMRTVPRERPKVPRDLVWEKFFGTMAKEICGIVTARTMREKPGDSPGGKPDSFSAFAAIAGIEQEDIVNEGLEDLDRIKRYNVGRESIFNIAHLMKDQDGVAQNLMFIHWRSECFTFPFTVSNSRERARAKDGRGVYFFTTDFDGIDFGSERPPRGARFAAAALAGQGDAQRYAGRAPGKGWKLFQFHRSREMGHLIIGRSRPLAPLIENERRTRLAFLFGFAIVLAGLGLGFGTLSRFLIRPVADLEEVVESLSHPRQGIPEIGNPVGELFLLAQLFREVKGSLSQLDLARIVQEDLLPAEYLEIGNMRMTGRSIMLEEVGGDFFDYIRDPRDPDWVYVCIGDATGHGLPAAIVVAMMGGALQMFMETDVVEPEALLNILNPQALRLLKRVRMTTLLLLRLNVRDGRFRMSNAGHPPLVKVASDGQTRTVEIPMFPIGAWPKAKFTGEDDRMLPGEGLVLSTDGCIETQISPDKMLGYAAFNQMVQEVLQEGFDGALDRFFGRLRHITREVPWNDDATLVVICWKSAGPPSQDLQKD